MTYTSVAKIAKVRCLLHKVLPAVYDESLSYLEQLAKLTYKVNETIDGVNVLNDNVDLLNDSVSELNERVTKVEGEIDGFEIEVTRRVAELERDLKASIDKAVDDMELEVDEKLASVDSAIQDLDRRMTELEKYVDETLEQLVTEVRELVNAEIERIQLLYNTLEADLRKYIEDSIEELIKNIPDLTNIYVIDPSTGKLVKVQEALTNTFAFNLYYGLSCNEINEIGYTCNDWNKVIVKSVPRGMTVREYLHDAKKILLDKVDIEVAKKWVNPHDTALGYLKGTTVWLDDNVDLNESMWAWSGSFTADEVNTNGFSCDDIIAFNISCEEYILRGNTIMIA